MMDKDRVSTHMASLFLTDNQTKRMLLIQTVTNASIEHVSRCFSDVSSELASNLRSQSAVWGGAKRLQSLQFQ